AVALPIPDAPPVTNATLPSTRPAIWRPPVPHDSLATVLMQMRPYVSVSQRSSAVCCTDSIRIPGTMVQANVPTHCVNHEGRAMSSQSLAPFVGQRYLYLESVKRDGTPVQTPVWFA